MLKAPGGDLGDTSHPYLTDSEADDGSHLVIVIVSRPNPHMMIRENARQAAFHFSDVLLTQFE